jgi:hypothetical protein
MGACSEEQGDRKVELTPGARTSGDECSGWVRCRKSKVEYERVEEVLEAGHLG